jgi:hypothetical protein
MNATGTGVSQPFVEHDSPLAIPCNCRQFSATRKRGKCLSRRAGQIPSVRMRFNRTKGVEEYFFKYWVDVPGQEERRRETKVIGPVKRFFSRMRRAGKRCQL